jgi:serine/threonine protein kinase/Tol biopolymer transport system component
MSPEQWTTVRDIFLAAVEIEDAARRASFITNSAGGDAGIEKAVVDLFRHDAQATGLMSRPALVEGFDVLLAENPVDDPLIGTTLGNYKIVREIGAGGMGAVYLATRADGSFVKQVALKLVKRGMDTHFVLSRFRQERQILAALDHPLIAGLLDGGTTAEGLPYFVMELVENGEPLYRYCDERRLNIAERLRLFRQICETVEYAHGQRIVHRDLKPSNILVKPSGTPCLLDFGIAKVLDPDLQADNTVEPTATQMRLMTPEYASPEQVRGETVTPASDIYSLGVLLYELLTGHRPYRFPSRAPFEIARVVCEQQPARPSVEITREDNFVPTGSTKTKEEIWHARGSRSLNDLRLEIAGDLERVILKALRKDPAERYGSAAALAADIADHLENRPVGAESFADVGESDGTAALPQPRGEWKISMRGVIALVVASVALVTVGFLVQRVVPSRTATDQTPASITGEWKTSFASTTNVKRLTTAGKTLTVAISPDGKQVAYVAEGDEWQDLLVRPTDGGEERRVASAENGSIKGVTFSPNGADLYYVLDVGGGTTGLYRIATTGEGGSEKASELPREIVGFAPDGKRAAYFGYDPKERIRTLYVAELNENKRLGQPIAIATRRSPLYFSGVPVFAPDGNKIAAIGGSNEESSAEIIVFDLMNGSEENLRTPASLVVSSIAWRSNGAEIVFTADEPRSGVSQIWLAEYPSGDTSRLTNDLNNYSGVSLSSDAEALVTIKSETTRNIWLTGLSAAETRGGFDARQITDGADRQDGLKGLSWSRANSILFVAGAAEENILTETDADGGNQRVINLGDARPVGPLLTSDDRFLIYADERSDAWTIWRRDRGSGETRPIAHVNLVAPVLTPDDRFLLYSATGSNEKISLHRLPVEGGEAVEITSDFCVRPAVSPDGKFIACYYNGETTGNRWEIAILNQNGGVPVRLVKPPDTLNLQTPFERPLAWSPDSRSIFYLNDAGGATNVFRIDAAGGSGKPARMTHFTSGRIFDFSLSPDGRRAVLSRGSTASDAVIFRSVR